MYSLVVPVQVLEDAGVDELGIDAGDLVHLIIAQTGGELAE